MLEKLREFRLKRLMRRYRRYVHPEIRIEAFDVVNNEVVKVIGIGGFGTNAVNTLISSGIESVEFIVANTDASNFDSSLVENKILLGEKLLNGIGAKTDHKKGEEVAIESKETLKQILSEADKVFVIAGLGGGTGTGAAPIVADIAKSAGALVFGIVVMPFSFEGEKRNTQAQVGLDMLKEKVDVLVVLQNDKFAAIAGKKATMKELYGMTDEILVKIVRGIVFE